MMHYEEMDGDEDEDEMGGVVTESGAGVAVKNEPGQRQEREKGGVVYQGALALPGSEERRMITGESSSCDRVRG
jgi:hypothetical protein